jgi:glucose-6-phosphate 1-dehydrogenase
MQFGNIEINSLFHCLCFFAAGDSQDTQTQTSAAAKGSSSTRDPDMEDVDKFVESLKYEDSQSQDEEDFKDSQALESENLLGNENNLKIFFYILGFFM